MLQVVTFKVQTGQGSIHIGEDVGGTFKFLRVEVSDWSFSISPWKEVTNRVVCTTMWQCSMESIAGLQLLESIVALRNLNRSKHR